MGAKIRGIFERARCLIKIFLLFRIFVTYITNNQYDNTNDIYI